MLFSRPSRGMKIADRRDRDMLPNPAEPSAVLAREKGEWLYRYCAQGMGNRSRVAGAARESAGLWKAKRSRSHSIGTVLRHPAFFYGYSASRNLLAISPAITFPNSRRRGRDFQNRIVPLCG